MIKNRVTVFILLLIVVVFAVSAVTGSARAGVSDCPEVPPVKWWVKTSHQKIIDYVTRKHHGDWIPYIDKWERQLAEMKTIYDDGGTAVFKKQETRIKDKELLVYIKAIETRLSATRCLALYVLEKEVAEIRGMKAASGENEPLAKSN